MPSVYSRTHSPSRAIFFPVTRFSYWNAAAPALPTRSTRESHSALSFSMSNSLNLRDVLPALLTNIFIFKLPRFFPPL